jgi:hypothetical protein
MLSKGQEKEKNGLLIMPMSKKEEARQRKMSKSERLIDCMKKAKGNASKVKTCKINFAAQTGTSKQHGWKPKG